MWKLIKRLGGVIILKFPNSIRFYRKKMGIKQQELADRIKISRTYLSYIENGYELPSIKILEEIALAINCNIGQLISTDIQDIILKYDSDKK